jgi:hypothetical protein
MWTEATILYVGDELLLYVGSLDAKKLRRTVQQLVYYMPWEWAVINGHLRSSGAIFFIILSSGFVAVCMDGPLERGSGENFRRAVSPIGCGATRRGRPRYLQYVRTHHHQISAE